MGFFTESFYERPTQTVSRSQFLSSLVGCEAIG